MLERSHRLEFGIERVLDNSSNVEATAFFDTTTGRGVGLMSFPSTAFSGSSGESFLHVANQQGSSRGMRVVYTRRLNRVWTASAGYAFGRGQRLGASGFSTPAELFESGLFQTGALQLAAGFDTGTHVRTVLRFSPEATIQNGFFGYAKTQIDGSVYYPVKDGVVVAESLGPDLEKDIVAAVSSHMIQVSERGLSELGRGAGQPAADDQDGVLPLVRGVDQLDLEPVPVPLLLDRPGRGLRVQFHGCAAYRTMPK